MRQQKEQRMDQWQKDWLAEGRKRYWEQYREEYDEIAAKRWMSKVEKTDDCWLWTGGVRAETGYGTFYYQRKEKYAHRWGYELIVGQIPEGLELDHLCRNRMCVNPAHLEPVTHRENVLRGTGGAAINAAKTHCIHGHEFSGDNLILSNRPSRNHTSRRCRTCKNESEKLRKRRLRAS